jgi:hypothetical protein
MHDSACNVGMNLADKLFKKRGCKVEAHMQKDELAALLAIAFQLGAEWESRRTNGVRVTPNDQPGEQK